jgi:hypothetical protein
VLMKSQGLLRGIQTLILPTLDCIRPVHYVAYLLLFRSSKTSCMRGKTVLSFKVAPRSYSASFGNSYGRKTDLKQTASGQGVGKLWNSQVLGGPKVTLLVH